MSHILLLPQHRVRNCCTFGHFLSLAQQLQVIPWMLMLACVEHLLLRASVQLTLVIPFSFSPYRKHFRISFSKLRMGLEACRSPDRLQHPTVCVDICMRPWWMLSMTVSVCCRSQLLCCTSGCTLHVYDVSMHLCDASFASFCLHACQARGEVAAGCRASVCSAVIRPDLRLTGAHREHCLVPHFLRNQWRWDLFTIFTQGIMMFDMTRFWVCLCEGYFHPLLPRREKTDRSYVHKRKKKEKKTSDHCLWMMLGRCISVLGLQNEALLCCSAGSVTHTRFRSLLHFA